MKRIFLLLFLIMTMFTFSNSLQKTGIREYDEIDHSKGKITTYFNEDGEKVKKETATYYRKNFGKIKDLYLIVDYDMEDKVVDIAKIRDLDKMYISEAGAEGENYTYYENGQIYSLINYKEGKREGEYNIYYEDNEPAAEKNYVMGKREGKQTGYYIGGQIAGEWNFSADMKDGHQVFYYPDGKMLGEAEYKDGEELELKFYYKNKKLLYKKTDENSRTFYENGKVMIDFQKEEMYDKNGKKITEEEFEKKYGTELQTVLEEGSLSRALADITYIIERY